MSRNRAAFTVVQNEPDWLPVWLQYYSRHFDARDLFVLDHDSAPAHAAALAGARAAGATVVPIHRHASFDHRWLRSMVERFQRFLLGSYAVVVFAEADEYLLVDPALHPGGLAGLCDAMAREGKPYLRAAGFNVVQGPDEPAYDWQLGGPLLASRSRWRADPWYDKTLVTRVPLRYGLGFHGIRNARQAAPEPGLYLAHLHRFDREQCLRKHREQAARLWNPEDLASGAGFQNRFVDGEEFETWFAAGKTVEEGPWAEIPDFARRAI